MRIRCPDYVSGLCSENCSGFLENPREDGRDANLTPTYTAICTKGGHLQYFRGLYPDIGPIETSAASLAEDEVEAINPIALVAASDNKFPALLADATLVQKATLMMQVATAKKLVEVEKTLNRVDDRSRNRTEAHEEKVARWGIEDRCLQLFNDYKAGRYGANLNDKGKRSIEDLLKHDQIKLILEQECGITTLKALKDAIVNARRRKKNTDG